MTTPPEHPPTIPDRLARRAGHAWRPQRRAQHVMLIDPWRRASWAAPSLVSVSRRMMVDVTDDTATTTAAMAIPGRQVALRVMAPRARQEPPPLTGSRPVMGGPVAGDRQQRSGAGASRAVANAGISPTAEPVWIRISSMTAGSSRRRRRTCVPAHRGASHSSTDGRPAAHPRLACRDSS
jgi:hypothetical protein